MKENKIKRLMKLSYFLLTLFISLVEFSLHAQPQNVEKQLIGTWIFDYETSVVIMSKASKAFYTKMNSSRKKDIQKKYQNRKISFNNNGLCVLTMSNGNNSTSKWIIDKNGEIKITTPKGNTKHFKISKIGLKKIILSPRNTFNKNVNILFTHWCLIKQ